MKLRNIISAVAAAAVAASAASLCAFADDQPAGYVYFMAEKTTLGQGFEVEPVKVPYYEGETGLDIVERAAEIKTEDTGYGAFITAFADTDSNDVVLPEAIAEVCTIGLRQNRRRLAERIRLHSGKRLDILCKRRVRSGRHC